MDERTAVISGGMQHGLLWYSTINTTLAGPRHSFTPEASELKVVASRVLEAAQVGKLPHHKDERESDLN